MFSLSENETIALVPIEYIIMYMLISLFQLAIAFFYMRPRAKANPKPNIYRLWKTIAGLTFLTQITCIFLLIYQQIYLESLR